MSNRSCPNAVSWCEGPDRYGDICKACLETWTNEAQVTHYVGDRCEPNGHKAPSAQSAHCPRCGGSGTVYDAEDDDGNTDAPRACPSCANTASDKPESGEWPDTSDAADRLNNDG